MILQKNVKKGNTFFQELKENMKRIDRNFNCDQERITSIRKILKIKNSSSNQMTVSEQNCRIDTHWSKKRWGLFKKHPNDTSYRSACQSPETSPIAVRNRKDRSHLARHQTEKLSDLDSDFVIA